MISVFLFRIKSLAQFIIYTIVFFCQIPKIFVLPIKKEFQDKNIIYTDYVSDEELVGLYTNALAFVSPSLEEGFGIPLLEAMACGVPVIAADNSSLGEILGGAGVLYKPNNAKELAKSLREVLGNAALQNQLKRKGLERAKDFSWKKCARETLEWLKS